MRRDSNDPSAELGELLPRIDAPIDNHLWVDRLAAVECPAFTARRKRREEASGANHDPIVWAAARGANVVDVLGNVYVDLSAGFGAILHGHAEPRITRAIETQLTRCVHAFGDVHPSDVKIELLEALTNVFRAFWPAPRAILGNNGSDAIDAAIKTARLHTKQRELIAFVGAYHGLMQGPLRLCGYSEKMRAPFYDGHEELVHFLPYPENEDDLLALQELLHTRLASGKISAIVVEPILGRGGVVIPPAGFLPLLRAETRAHNALLIVDEIWTGFYRTGPRFAFENSGVVPDLVCVGKALGGGLPLSACLGDLNVMGAWGTSDQESLHTATFFGHPLACAAGLAFLQSCAQDSPQQQVAAHAEAWRLAFEGMPLRVRQNGLAIALVGGKPGAALTWVAELLQRGFIALPAGADAASLQLSPSLAVTEAQRKAFVRALREILAEHPELI